MCERERERDRETERDRARERQRQRDTERATKSRETLFSFILFGSFLVPSPQAYFLKRELQKVIPSSWPHAQRFLQ